MRRTASLLLAGAIALTAGEVRVGRSHADPVKVIVIEIGPDRAAIAVSDSTEWDGAGAAAAKRAIESASGIPAANVILAATKPGNGMKPVAQKAIDAAKSAVSAMVPAVLSTGHGREDSISFYRRFLMKDGSVRADPARGDAEIVQPVGEADSELQWLHADSPGTGPVAALSVFPLSAELAAHPAVSVRTLGKLLGPAAVLVAVGPSANASPVDIKSKETPSAQKIGTVLAGESLKAWARAKPLAPGRMRMLREMVRLAGDVEAEVQVLALGDRFAIVALPGDVFSELGVAIRRASPFAETMVIGLANGSIGIVPTAKAFKEGGADVKRARIQPGGGEQLAEAALRMLGVAKREVSSR